MKKDITQLDRDLGKALMELDISDTEPDFHAMFEKVEAMAQQRSGRLRVKRVVRRTLLVAALAVCLLMGSIVIAALSSPADARADSWFDRAVIGLRSVLRLETTSEELIDAPMPRESTYTGIEAARQDGYTGYAPTYLPEGYTVKSVQLLSGQTLTRAGFDVTDGRQALSLTYVMGKNTQMDVQLAGDETIKPFMWNGFVGAIIERSDGSSSLSCVNKDTDEMMSCSGPISSQEIDEIITHMEKAETPP